MLRVNDLDEKIGVLVYGQRTIIYTTQELPTRNALSKLPQDEQIAVVCERYKMWMLQFAVELINQPNAGYAALSILNSYFDMIAQFSGHSHDDNSVKKRVEIGLKAVFPELEDNPGIATLLAKHLRNPMAHMGMTEDSIVLIELYDEPLVWGSFHGEEALVINPRLWVKQISDHFEEFYAMLRDPSPEFDELRRRFLQRIHNSA